MIYISIIIVVIITNFLVIQLRWQQVSADWIVFFSSSSSDFTHVL